MKKILMVNIVGLALMLAGGCGTPCDADFGAVYEMQFLNDACLLGGEDDGSDPFEFDRLVLAFEDGRSLRTGRRNEGGPDLVYDCAGSFEVIVCDADAGTRVGAGNDDRVVCTARSADAPHPEISLVASFTEEDDWNGQLEYESADGTCRGRSVDGRLVLAPVD